jgi:hypothetical protein
MVARVTLDEPGRRRDESSQEGAVTASADAIECFGCGNRFARELLEEVGDTVFCRACHARMLRRIDERRARGPDGSGPTAVDGRPPVRGHAGPVAGASPADRAATAKPTAADAPCFVCGGPLAGSTLFELRGFSICGSCARALIGDEPPAVEAAPGAPDARDDDDDDDDDVDDDVDDDELDAAPRPIAPEGSGQTAGPLGSVTRGGSSRVVGTPGTGTEWCSGCGRAMPGRGSYQLIGGRPYCPACVVARAAKTGPVRAIPEDETAPADACDACNRPIDRAAVPETKGFRLCAACLNSDPELAIALARSRHQRRLARAGRRLLDGDDD